MFFELPLDNQDSRYVHLIFNSTHLLIFLIVGLVAVTAFNSFVNRRLIDVIIQEKDASQFASTLTVYAIGLICVTLLAGFTKDIRKKIALDW